MPTTQDATDSTASSVHLDAIRGAAALVVLLGHTRDLFFSSLTAKPTENSHSSTGQNIPPRPAPASGITIGNEAVMIFFVLSGYLVGGSAIKALKRNTWSWKNYLIKRMTRLWVVLLPALLLGVALDYAGLHHFAAAPTIYAAPPQQLLVAGNLASRLSLRVVAANAVFLQEILVSTAGTNESLWSLANEFWYYIAFPVLLLALSNKQKPWVRGVYLLAFAGIALFVGKSISLLFFVWVLGAVLSVVPLKLPQKPAKVLAVLFAILLPILLVLVRRSQLSRYVADSIVALIFTLTLYLILHQTERARGGIYQSVASFFSRISYTLYLVHLPMAVLLCAFINNPWHLWSKSPKNLLIFLALNAGLVLASYLFYLLFEANTDKVRYALFHRRVRDTHLPRAA